MVDTDYIRRTPDAGQRHGYGISSPGELKSIIVFEKTEKRKACSNYKQDVYLCTYKLNLAFVFCLHTNGHY